MNQPRATATSNYGGTASIVKRFELAFEAAELTFHKTRPMRIWLTRMGSDPGSLVTEETAERFPPTLWGCQSSVLTKTEYALCSLWARPKLSQTVQVR